MSATPQKAGDVLINVSEGTKLTYEVKEETKTWGSDGNSRFLMAPTSSLMVLEVTVGKPTRVLNFTNRVTEYSVGKRKAMSRFGPDNTTWPTWSDRLGVMSGAMSSQWEDKKTLETVMIVQLLFGPSGPFVASGQFVYRIPLGLNFRQEPWALGDEVFIVYKWTKQDDKAIIDISRSSFEPQYGSELYRKDRTYVTGRAELSLKDGLLLSSDVTIDDDHQVVHLITKRL